MHRNELFIKSFIADGAVAPFRAVKFGTAATHAAQATAATDATFGLADSLGADGAGDNLDVIVDGIGTGIAGGTIAAGDFLTADSQGRLVKATTGRVLGFAWEPAVVNDQFGVKLNPTVLPASA